MAKRVALVTGGMGGIGQAICQALHQQGITVIAAYHRPHEAAKAWQAEQRAAGYSFEIAYGDVSDPQSCEAMAEHVLSTIGPIDILVNNAGGPRDRTCSKMTTDEWDSVIETNLNSVFYVTRAFLNSMKTRMNARIINISSINGQKGQFGQTNYSAAKAGVHGFTKALALEMAKHSLTVNTISPGYVATQMVLSIPADIRDKILAEIPMGRFAKPEEVANVVVFLADEKNSYITGANIAINGGHYMA